MSRCKDSWQLYDCDRTGFTHRKCDLVRQNGVLVARSERDDPDPVDDSSPFWGEARPNADTITPVTSPRVLAVAAGTGINSLPSSFDFPQDGVHETSVVHIISSGGLVTITANPGIVAGQDGHRLTLRGTSDSDRVKLTHGNGVSLNGEAPFLFGSGDTMVLVYTGGVWTEVSRAKGGV